jgi:hypothetical protein
MADALMEGDMMEVPINTMVDVVINDDMSSSPSSRSSISTFDSDRSSHVHQVRQSRPIGLGLEINSYEPTGQFYQQTNIIPDLSHRSFPSHISSPASIASVISSLGNMPLYSQDMVEIPHPVNLNMT